MAAKKKGKFVFRGEKKREVVVLDKEADFQSDDPTAVSERDVNWRLHFTLVDFINKEIRDISNFLLFFLR